MCQAGFGLLLEPTIHASRQAIHFPYCVWSVLWHVVGGTMFPPCTGPHFPPSQQHKHFFSAWWFISKFTYQTETRCVPRISIACKHESKPSHRKGREGRVCVGRLVLFSSSASQKLCTSILPLYIHSQKIAAEGSSSPAFGYKPKDLWTREYIFVCSWQCQPQSLPSDWRGDMWLWLHAIISRWSFVVRVRALLVPPNYTTKQIGFLSVWNGDSVLLPSVEETIKPVTSLATRVRSPFSSSVFRIK